MNEFTQKSQSRHVLWRYVYLKRYAGHDPFATSAARTTPV
jgi:hypothetical protein